MKDKAFVNTEFMGALWDGESLDKPGDSNAAAYFNGGEFMLFTNPSISAALDPNGEAPFGYAYEFWMKADKTDGFASILDNGLYQSDAELPAAGSLKLPIYAERVATVDEQGNKGWLVNVWLDEGASANLGDSGIGSRLSPLNLSFAAPAQSHTFAFPSTGGSTVQQSLDLPLYAFGDLLKYSTTAGVLTGLQANGESVLLHTQFIADANSPADDKTSEKSAELDLNLSVQQVKGWSLRKQLVNGVEKLVYTYGEDSNGTPATIEGSLNSDDWNHVYLSYSTDRLSGQKVAELWINGELAGMVDDTPIVDASGKLITAPKGFDLNLLPIAVGHGYEGQLDELVVHSKSLDDPGEELPARLLSRYVNPKSASEATFFSTGTPLGGIQQGDTNRLSQWTWGAPQTFTYSNYIPSTTPGYSRPAVVDLTTSGQLGALRGDGKEDLRLPLRIDQLPYGSEITGIHIVASNGQRYGIGEGLSRGLDGKPLTSSQPLSGLIAVAAEGRLVNTTGTALDLSIMTQELNLDLYLPGPASLLNTVQQVQVFYKNPDDLQLGTQSSLRFVDSTSDEAVPKTVTALPSRSGGSDDPNGMLAPNNPAGLKDVTGGSGVPHQAVAQSLKDINTGFGVTLATAADGYSLDPATGKESNASFAERIELSTLRDGTNTVQLAAISSSTYQPDASHRGVVWVVDLSTGTDARQAAAKLSALGSLATDAPSALDAAGLKGVEILGKPGQTLAESMLWADLDRDGKPELIIGNPSANAGAGEVVIISGAHLWTIAKNTGAARRIDLSKEKYSSNNADVRVLKGAAGSAFGFALSAANFVTASASDVDLAIGAPDDLSLIHI